MPNFIEEDVSGKIYVKAVRFIAEVSGTDSGITIVLERGFIASDGRKIALPSENISEGINASNANESYPLKNPTTGVNLGQNGTYQELYVRLMSLVPYLATKNNIT